MSDIVKNNEELTKPIEDKNDNSPLEKQSTIKEKKPRSEKQLEAFRVAQSKRADNIKLKKEAKEDAKQQEKEIKKQLPKKDIKYKIEPESESEEEEVIYVKKQV